MALTVLQFPASLCPPGSGHSRQAGSRESRPAAGGSAEALWESPSLPGAETGDAQVPSEVYGLTQSARPRTQTPAAQPKPSSPQREQEGHAPPRKRLLASHSGRGAGPAGDRRRLVRRSWGGAAARARASGWRRGRARGERRLRLLAGGWGGKRKNREGGRASGEPCS